MTTRERAELDGQLVTVIGPSKNKGKIIIRDQFGMTHEVSRRQLKRLDKDDPRASFTFGDDNA